MIAPSGFPFATVLSECPVAFIHSFVHSRIQLLLVVYGISEDVEGKLQPRLQKAYLEGNLGFILWFVPPH